MARVLISAGHTIMDPGAIFKDMREADLTRKIAPKVIPFLEDAGIEVQGVPLDLPLWQRLEWINNTGYTEEDGDILIEIHVNDSDGSKRGIEAWYKGKGGNPSQKLAKAVIDSMVKDGYESQGIKSEFEHELGSLTFLNRPKPTALLLETLYMDNPEDSKLLKDDSELENLAKSVAKGILAFLGKDLNGDDLAESDKPKYDDLKEYSVSKDKATDSDNDDDGFFSGLGGLFGSSKNDDKPVTSPTPAPKPQPQPTAKPNFGGMPKPPGVAGFGTNSGASNGGGNMMMDRQQRREMIETTYVKILGRKPSQSDLNFFLNQGINEADLLKKMMESQEHADIVKAKQSHEELKEDYKKIEDKVKRMEATIRDQKEMMDQLNRSVMHKNSPASTVCLAKYTLRRAGRRETQSNLKPRF